MIFLNNWPINTSLVIAMLLTMFRRGTWEVEDKESVGELLNIVLLVQITKITKITKISESNNVGITKKRSISC